MIPDGDPRVSDEATGLPPLELVENETTLVVLAWAGSEGLAWQDGRDGSDEPVRFLHVRGIVNGGPTGIEWAQMHIAVPVPHAVDVAACLATGGASPGEATPQLSDDERLAWLEQYAAADDGEEPPTPNDVALRAAVALIDEFGIYYDPVLVPATLLRIARIVLGAAL